VFLITYIHNFTNPFNVIIWLRGQNYIVELSTTTCMLGHFNRVLHVVVDLEKLSFDALTID